MNEKEIIETIKTIKYNIETKEESIEAYIYKRNIDVDYCLSKIKLPLRGLPLSVKDNYNFKGHPMTCGSNALNGYISTFNSDVVKLLEDAGAFIVGKTNMDEFAMGSTTETSFYKTTKNPANLKKVPGGSSGGAAASVSAGECVIAIGSDTGGSVRQPASFCGVYGFKPSYGAISRYGLVGYSPSLDTVGIIANFIEDVDLVFKILRIYTGNDLTQQFYYNKSNENRYTSSKIRIGYFNQFVNNNVISNEIKNHFNSYLDILRSHYSLEKLDFPHADYLTNIYYTIASSEAASELMRYDGSLFGSRPDKYDISQRRKEFFGQEVKSRISVGTYALRESLRNQYFDKALELRNYVIYHSKEIFKNVDIIVSPVSPVLPYDIGNCIEDSTILKLWDIYTVYANLCKIPAISVPVGKLGGLPIGIQFMADYGNDEHLLNFIKELKACGI